MSGGPTGGGHSDAPNLLLVSHSRTGSAERLAGAVREGVTTAWSALEVTGRLVELDAPDAGLDHIEGASGVIFVTPARFGALAGLMKDFLERIYPWFEEVPDVRPGLAWTAVVKGASDPSGAVRDLERILTGLRWNQVLAPVSCVGELTEAHLADATELGATFAAGVAEGLW